MRISTTGCLQSGRIGPALLRVLPVLHYFYFSVSDRLCLVASNCAATRTFRMRLIARTGVLLVAFCLVPFRSVRGDTTPLTLLDPNLQVTTYLGSNLSQPIGIVFLGPGD